MEIKGVNSIARAYQEQLNISNNRKNGKTSSSQQADEVVLSSQAQEFSQTLKALKNCPEIREAKIKEISDKIINGTYNIASGDIAESIIRYSKI